MNNTIRLRSTSTTFLDHSSISAQNAASFRQILYRRPPPTTPRTEQSYVIVNSMVNDHANDPFTRSILMDNAAKQRGFLPYDYRFASTFESIRRHRSCVKPSSKVPVATPRCFDRTSTRSDAFGNLTGSMSKLAEQRLILREKSVRKTSGASLGFDRHEKSSLMMSDADFASDIPSALEFIARTAIKKSSTEQHLLETLKRERLTQARYRLLPVNRSP